MKALVTGAAGFIGGHLIDTLRAHGHGVVGLDKRPGRGVDVTCDLADPDSGARIADLGAGADVVFHLAARAGVRDRQPGIEQLRHRDNVGATHRLFEALPLRVPIVAASSSSVYGCAEWGRRSARPSREEDPLWPRGGYAASKVLMEKLCERRRRMGGRVTVLRLFTVVGERQRRDMALARWSEALHHGHSIRIFGSPDRLRDLTDVRDVARAFTEAAEVGHNGVLNVGTGVGYRTSAMAAALMEASGMIAEVAVDPGFPEEVEATLADTTACRRVLGFVPTTDLAEVARRVWHGYLAPREINGVAAR